MSANIVQTYRAFAYNNAWANHRLLTACQNLSQAEFEAARTGFFPSLQKTLNHILIIADGSGPKRGRTRCRAQLCPIFNTSNQPSIDALSRFARASRLTAST